MISENYYEHALTTKTMYIVHIIIMFLLNPLPECILLFCRIAVLTVIHRSSRCNLNNVQCIDKKHSAKNKNFERPLVFLLIIFCVNKVMQKKQLYKLPSYFCDLM